MKKNLYKLCGVLLLCVVILVVNACKDEFYTIDESFYDDVEISLKNNVIEGLNGAPDTLRLEQDNIEQLMIESPSNPDLIFAPESFIYQLSKDEIISVGDDGTITPVSRDTVLLDITFRANKNLKIPLVVIVYKEYQPVTEIQVPASVLSTLIEVDESYDLSKMLIVLPVNADNKKLHFSMDEASLQYATITDEGFITGVKTSGRNRATINVWSDDNPDVKASFRVQVVNEILVTAVNVTPGLDGVEIGIGATIDLNLCTSVSPATVNVNNRKLTFELIEGAGILSLSDEGIMTALAVGTAKVKATSKNGISTQFTIKVKEGLTDLLRLLWTVNTSGYDTTDNTNGAPNLMFDGNASTYSVFVKPGKSYNGVSPSADHIPYFTVDMKSAQKFNYIRWNHRSGNSEVGLRVWGIQILGSDTGYDSDFTEIQLEKLNEATGEMEPLEYIELDTSKTSRQDISIPESEYRYVRIMLTNWSDNSGGVTTGNTMQVGEFGLGYK